MKRIPIILVFLMTIFMCRSFVTQWGWIGESDMDQALAYQEVARISILQYGQFPHWNPFYCGGNVLNAHSHSQNLTPFFLLNLLMPSHDALKIFTFAHYLIQFLGFWFLLGFIRKKVRSQMTDSSLTLAIQWGLALIATFNSHMTLRNQDGFLTQATVAYFPWIVLCLLKYLSMESTWKAYRWPAIAGALYGLMILEAGINIVPDTGLVLGLGCLFGIPIAKSRSEYLKQMLGFFSLFLFFGLGLSAAKTLPLIDFTRDFPRIHPTDSHLPWSALWTTFFNQKQDIRFQAFAGQTHGYTEYSAYIGWLIPLIFLQAIFHVRNITTTVKRYVIPLALLSGLILWLCHGGGKTPGLWEILHHFPVYKSFHIPSRFLIFFVFVLTMLSWLLYLGFSKTMEQPWKKTLFVLLALVCVIDFTKVNRKPLEKMFAHDVDQLKASLDLAPGDPFDQVFTSYQYGFAHDPYYPLIEKHVGRLNCFENTVPPKRATPTRGENAEPLVFLQQNDQPVHLVSWSPNRITVSDLQSWSSENPIIYNQNYYRGWNSTAGEVQNIQGRVGVVPKSQQTIPSEIQIYYEAPLFRLGVWLNLVSILVWLFVIWGPSVAVFLRNRRKSRAT